MLQTTSPIPLQLDEFFLNKLNIEWRNLPGDTDHRHASVRVLVSYDFAQHTEIPHAYQMTLSVKGEDVMEKANDAGYKFEAVIVGRYRIENAKSPELEARLSRVNGVSLLYSTLRGILSNVTGSFEFGKVVLPSINPQAIVEQIEKAKLPEPKGEPSQAIIPTETIAPSQN